MDISPEIVKLFKGGGHYGKKLGNYIYKYILDI